MPRRQPDAKGPKLGFNTGGGVVYKPLKAKISLRARNLNSDKLKVNDKRGNPIEIAAVVVWRVEDTAQAAFDVDDYENYVTVQSEAAVRAPGQRVRLRPRRGRRRVTLRGGGDEVAHALEKELQERLAKAGVVVDEARLTHLAYAPEIAQAMLRRQQAEAIIARAQKIVHGAVSMVEMALQRAGREAGRRSSTRSARPRWSATCWSCCAARPKRARHQHGHALQLIVAEERKSFLLRLRPSSGRSSRSGRPTSCAA